MKKPTLYKLYEMFVEVNVRVLLIILIFQFAFENIIRSQHFFIVLISIIWIVFPMWNFMIDIIEPTTKTQKQIRRFLFKTKLKYFWLRFWYRKTKQEARKEISDDVIKFILSFTIGKYFINNLYGKLGNKNG